jgi:arabinose-5-phosphate isomerase
MSIKQVMIDVLVDEAKALEKAAQRLQTQDEVSDLGPLLRELSQKGGSLIFCGVGKSGHIGRKIAATFMSLGLSSYFLHPTEALHGDLGRVKEDDVIVFLSKSGTTDEIIKILPYLPMPQSKRVAMVGRIDSAIAKGCDLVLDCSVEKEACVNNQAPTTSSTLTLSMGDAMAVVFEKEIGLSKEGFAQNHPAGLLGKSMHMKVAHLLTKVEDCPVLPSNSTLKDALIEMTKKPVGGLAVIEKGLFLGLVVDGDIRRFLAKETIDLSSPLSLLMNKKPTSIGAQELAITALALMESGERSFSIIPVLDNTNFLGFLRLHDLVKEGFK